MNGTKRTPVLFFPALVFSLFFSVCLEAQPGGNDCPSATEICNFPVVSSNAGATATAPFSICGNPNWVENNVFYSFVAGSSFIELFVEVSNCASVPIGLDGGLQGEIYETPDCVTFTELDCFTGPFPGATPVDFSLSFNAVVGETYILMIDGFGGDVCDYDISLTQGSVGAPSSLDPIEGPALVCINDQETYLVPNMYDEFTWTINPPLGSIVGSPTGNEIEILWTGGGIAEICATATNCNLQSPQECMLVEIVDVPPTNIELDICLDGSAECAGETFSSPGFYPVVLTSAEGCDSIVNCILNLIPPVPPTLITEDICGPIDYENCGSLITTTGIHEVICTSAQGCDSLVLVDLAIMTPMPSILTPDTLDCAVNATVILDGSNSNYNLAVSGTTDFVWTGPGIVGNNNTPTITVNETGTYCLELIHARNGIACSESTCVEVVGGGEVPEMPTMEGDSTACLGDSLIYTVSPNGSVGVDSFAWSISNGDSIRIISMDSIALVWANLQGGQLCVTADNACGQSDSTCLDIEVSQAPNSLAIEGPEAACNGTDPFLLFHWLICGGCLFLGSPSGRYFYPKCRYNFSGFHRCIQR